MRDLGPIYSMLEPYLERPRLSGQNNVAALCPLPDHPERKASFAVNIENGLWMCHGCNRSGGLVSLLKYIGLSGRRIDALTEPVRAHLDNYRRKHKRKRRAELHLNPLESDVQISESIAGIFHWKPLDLVEQGFDPHTLEELGIGYDRGRDRITFPIRDTYGNLVGFSGRATIAGDEPKYKVYTGGYRQNGELYPGDLGPEFDELYPNYVIDSHDHLWNGHRVYAAHLHGGFAGPLIIVEGFKACIWLIQHGYSNVVALMGSNMSKKQHRLLHTIGPAKVLLLLDNDRPGREATLKIGKWLARTRHVWVGVYYPAWAEEPDALNAQGLIQTIESKERFTTWKSKYAERFAQDEE